MRCSSALQRRSAAPDSNQRGVASTTLRRASGEKVQDDGSALEGEVWPRRAVEEVGARLLPDPDARRELVLELHALPQPSLRHVLRTREVAHRRIEARERVDGGVRRVRHLPVGVLAVDASVRRCERAGVDGCSGGAADAGAPRAGTKRRRSVVARKERHRRGGRCERERRRANCPAKCCRVRGVDGDAGIGSHRRTVVHHGEDEVGLDGGGKSGGGDRAGGRHGDVGRWRWLEWGVWGSWFV
jgi:hypothetical protein